MAADIFISDAYHIFLCSYVTGVEMIKSLFHVSLSCIVCLFFLSWIDWFNTHFAFGSVTNYDKG